MEQQTGITRQALSAAAQGHQPGGQEWRIPSGSVIVVLDRGLRGGSDLEAAHDLAKRIVTRRQQTLGPDHRDTVASIDLLQDVRAKQRQQRGEGTKRGIGARRWRRK